MRRWSARAREEGTTVYTIREILESLPVHAYDELTERLVEVVAAESPTDEEDPGEPDPEILAEIEARIEQEALAEARKWRWILQRRREARGDAEVSARFAGSHVVYRQGRQILRIPVEGYSLDELEDRLRKAEEAHRKAEEAYRRALDAARATGNFEDLPKLYREARRAQRRVREARDVLEAARRGEKWVEYVLGPADPPARDRRFRGGLPEYLQGDGVEARPVPQAGGASWFRVEYIPSTLRNGSAPPDWDSRPDPSPCRQCGSGVALLDDLCTLCLEQKRQAPAERSGDGFCPACGRWEVLQETPLGPLCGVCAEYFLQGPGVRHAVGFLLGAAQALREDSGFTVPDGNGGVRKAGGRAYVRRLRALLEKEQKRLEKGRQRARQLAAEGKLPPHAEDWLRDQFLRVLDLRRRLADAVEERRRQTDDARRAAALTAAAAHVMVAAVRRRRNASGGTRPRSHRRLNTDQEEGRVAVAAVVPALPAPAPAAVAALPVPARG